MSFSTWFSGLDSNHRALFVGGSVLLGFCTLCCGSCTLGLIIQGVQGVDQRQPASSDLEDEGFEDAVEEEARRVTYTVSKGYFKGDITVELVPGVSREIELDDLELDGSRITFTLVKRAYSGREISDQWRYSVYDENEVKLESGWVTLPGLSSMKPDLGIGSAVKAHVFIGSEERYPNSPERVVIHY